MRAPLFVGIGLLLLVACSDEHEQLMKELNHQAPVRRAGAVASLAKLGDDEAYMLVSRSLQDRSAIVRIAAVRSLAAFEGRETLAGVIRVSRDLDPEVRQAAVLALSARKGKRIDDALLQMLLRGEPVSQVRKAIYKALEERELSGEGLATRMAESQMARAREQLANGQPSDRARVVRMAGRSIHSDGVDLVMEGLADRDQDVVLSALGALHGRGAKPAMRQLQLLLADQVESIRLSTVQALAAFGEDGLTLLEAALRDPEAKVRLAVLGAFQEAKAAPDGALLCKLLGDSDPAVALTAAGLHGGDDDGGAGACDLGPISALLKADNPMDRRKAMAVLSALGGEKAVLALELALKDVVEQDRLSLSAALARAGSKRPDVARHLQSAFDDALSEIDLLAEGWVSGKLPARGSGSSEPSPFDGNSERTRLSEEELSRLYKKHGLGPANPDSPRGINDILAGFEEPDPQKLDPRLFGPVSTDMVDRISMALDGLLYADPQKAGAAVGRALALKSSAAQARVAQVLLTHGVTVELSDQMLTNLASAVAVADVAQTRALADWVSRSKDPRLVALLIGASEKSDWEKRLPLIDALGRIGGSEAIKALTGMLRGYSAISAARALAKIGDKQAIEPLRLALKQAGPAEEMEILLALAKLGSKAEVPRLVAKLDDSNPDLRLFAVQVLGEVGPGQGLDALEGLRYDLDRLVRAEVKRVLVESNTGGQRHGSPKEAVEGRSVQPAEKRKVPKGPGAVPAGGGTGSR